MSILGSIGKALLGSPDDYTPPKTPTTVESLKRETWDKQNAADVAASKARMSASADAYAREQKEKRR